MNLTILSIIIFCFTSSLSAQTAWTTINGSSSGITYSTQQRDLTVKWQGIPGSLNTPPNYVTPIKVSYIVNDGQTYLINTLSPKLLVTGSQNISYNFPEGKIQLKTEWGTYYDFLNGDLDRWYGPTPQDVYFYVDMQSPTGLLQLINNTGSIFANDNIGISKIEFFANYGSGSSIYNTTTVATAPGVKTFSIVVPEIPTPGTAAVIAKIYDFANRFVTTNSINLSKIGVSVSPAEIFINPNEQRQFSATVVGSSDTGVTWSATLGTITASGLYTAGDTIGTAKITATSNWNNAATATATAYVTPYKKMFSAVGSSASGLTPPLQLDKNESILPIDFDGDNLTDILAWNRVSHQQCLFRNTGNGSFVKMRDEIGSATAGITPGFWLDNNEEAMAIDINNDGKQDLLVRNKILHTHAIYISNQNGNGQFYCQGIGSGTEIVPDFWLDNNERIVPLDYNGDSRMDLLVYNVVNHTQGIYDFSIPTKRVKLYQNTTAATSVVPGFWLDSNEVITVFDFNGDKKADLFVYNKINHNQALYKGNGDGTFERISYIQAATAETSLLNGFWMDQNEEIIPINLNNDLFQDVIVRNKKNHYHAIFQSNGIGGFAKLCFDSNANITEGHWLDSNENIVVGNFYIKPGLPKSDIIVNNFINLSQSMYKNCMQ